MRLRVGDAVDFWRVEALTPGRLLRLRAEMKLPGRAWLQFEVDPVTDESPEGAAERSRITQSVFFEPKGLLGTAYWHAVRPVHGLLFGGLLRRLVGWMESRAPAATAFKDDPPSLAELREYSHSPIRGIGGRVDGCTWEASPGRHSASPRAERRSRDQLRSQMPRFSARA